LSKNLTKRYGGQLAVSDESFRCEPGTVTGFLGPNGAGKSTTMGMLLTGEDVRLRRWTVTSAVRDGRRTAVVLPGARGR
jgi:ABC-type branched-subunit amino acid transport system ATPase component